MLLWCNAGSGNILIFVVALSLQRCAFCFSLPSAVMGTSPTLFLSFHDSGWHWIHGTSLSPRDLNAILTHFFWRRQGLFSLER